MPPKRAASTAATAAGRAKKAKTGAAATKAAPKAAAAPKNPPKSKRWSAVSGSGNADAEFKKIAAKNPDEFFSFICTCPPTLASGDDDDSDKWEDEDKDNEDGEDEDEEGSGGGCGRPNCKCHKPMNEYPDHPWIITKAGYRKLYTMQIFVTLRDPDNFNMYTYNDHAGYGVLEVVENLLLDYVEAENSWKDQWVVCEATSRFLLHGMSTPMLGVDDSERVTSAVCLVGVMFLSMLARLEREKLLAEGSEVKDLGVVMALYMKVAASMRESSILDEDDGDDESSSSKAKKTFTYDASRFDDYILAYADKFGIPLKGPNDIEELLSQRDSGVSLPGGTDGNNDPWGWKAALKNYEKDHGTGRAGKSKIGGDQLDITTWTKSERQDASFDGKDPLGKRDLDALKKGMVMQLG